MKKFKSVFSLGLVALFLFMTPFMFVNAQVTDDCSGVEDNSLQFILCRIAYLINSAIPVLIALAVVIFIWGVIQYVISGDEESKSKGRNMMIYGLIGILVIVTIWGLVSLLRNSFGIGTEGVVPVPCITGAGVEC